MPDVREIERVAHAVVEMQEVDRQAVVERVAGCVNDPGVGKQPFDQPDVQKIVGPLVRDALAVRKQPREHVEIARGQLIQLCLRRRRHRRRKRREPAAHERRQEWDFAACRDLRVRGQDLLRERRARAEHSANEQRPSRIRASRSDRLTRCERGDQRVDEPLVRAPVVRRTRPGTAPAFAIRGSVRGKCRIPVAAGIQGFAQREAQVGPVSSGRADVGDGCAQLRDQRIVRARDLLQPRAARQGDIAVRLQRQHLLVQRARFGLLAEVLAQVREVEQGRDIVGIQRERSLELTFSRVILTQAVGVDHAPVEMNLFGLRDAAIECLLI